MSPVTNLSACRQEYLRQEAITALVGGRWKDTNAVVKRVRQRWGWATDTEIHSAIDQLHEEGRLDSRHHKRPAGLGSIDEIQWVVQWRLLPLVSG